jgi:hypothetical protein
VVDRLQYLIRILEVAGLIFGSKPEILIEVFMAFLSDLRLGICPDLFSCGYTAQFWALVASMKLSVSVRQDSLDG